MNGDFNGPPAGRIRLPAVLALIAVLLLILGLLAGLAWMFAQQRQDLIADAVEEASQEADDAVLHVGHLLHMADLILVDVADRVVGRPFDDRYSPDRFRQLLAARAASLPLIRQLRVFDRTGQLTDHGADGAAGAESVAADPVFRRHRDQWESRILAGPEWSPAEQGWVLSLSRPIGAPGPGFDGMVQALIDPQAVLTAHHERDQIVLYDDSGRILAIADRHTDPAEMIGQTLEVLPPLADLIETPRPLRVEMTLVAGTMAIATRPVPDTRLAVAVVVRMAEPLAAWRQRVYAAAAGGLVLFVLAAVLLLAAARQWRQSERLQDHLRIVRRALAAAGSGVIIARVENGGQRIIDVNRAVEQITGHGAEDLQDRDPAFLFDADQPERAALTNAVAERREVRLTLHGPRKDGGRFWCDLHLAPVPGADGTVGHFITILQDTTRRRETERELEERTEALERSNAELEQFAYVASHDLQEPLRMVGSYVQLLQRRYGDRLGKDAEAYIDYAVEGTQRMKQLIRDLLEFSRVTTRGREPAPVAMREVFAQALVGMTATIEETAAEITLPADPPLVLADTPQIARVVQNLIANALKYHHPERAPVVTVTAERDGDMWCFAVADNGIGIDPVYFDRIFVLFQRLHGRDSYGGTGIGLAVAKRIIERHGGRIWVDAMPGQGATFLFTLPAVDES